jgi:hypothetical protein
MREIKTMEGKLVDREQESPVIRDKWKCSGEARTAIARNDPRTAHELITLALTDPDESVVADAVTTLHYRATREVFAAARDLCASDCVQERELGVDILGQLGIPVRAFLDESVRMEATYQHCKLPEAPGGMSSLNDLLVRLRLGNHVKE